MTKSTYLKVVGYMIHSELLAEHRRMCGACIFEL